MLSHDRQHLQGWITRQEVLQTLATSVSSSAAEIEHGAVAADFAARDPEALAHTPSTPLSGYEIVEITINPESPALGRRAGNIAWPPGSLIVAISEGHEIVPVRNDTELHAGEQIILLAPAATQLHSAEQLRSVAFWSSSAASSGREPRGRRLGDGWPPRSRSPVVGVGEVEATAGVPAELFWLPCAGMPPASLSIRARCIRFQARNVVLRLVKSFSGPPEPGSR